MPSYTHNMAPCIHSYTGLSGRRTTRRMDSQGFESWMGAAVGGKSKSVKRGRCEARPTVTFPAAGHQSPLTVTQVILLNGREAHVRKQLTQDYYLKVERPGFEHTTF